MFGMGPQKFLSKAANNKPAETNDVPNATRPGQSKQADTTTESGKMNSEGTNVDLENNKQANINDANVDKSKINSDTPSKSKEEPGFWSALRDKIKSSVKNKAMDGMTSVMEGKQGKSEGMDKQSSDSPTAPGENRPSQQKLPQPDKTRPKPRVPDSEGSGVSMESLNTPVSRGVDIPKPSVPGGGFKMPVSNVPRMPKFR
jgi:hypothetical protein